MCLEILDQHADLSCSMQELEIKFPHTARYIPYGSADLSPTVRI